MKSLKQREVTELLSRFVDNRLTDEERRLVSQLTANDPSAKRELDELLRLRALLAPSSKLKPDIGFSTRLSAVLAERQREEENLFPVSRKYIPAMIALSSAAFLLVVVLVVQKRNQVGQFVGEQSLAVKSAVENNILKSAILPLFTSVNRDQALQFALFGSVLLDEKNEASLRVDDRAEKGYRIEVTTSGKSKRQAVTVKDFVAEIKPNLSQQESIDSILDFTRRRIQSSILVGEGDLVAVDPDLPRLNVQLVGNIAACLSKEQQFRFERMLRAHKAPSASHLARTRAERYTAVSPLLPGRPRRQQFMVITPETLVMTNLGIDFDEISKKIDLQDRVRQEVLNRRDRFIARGLHIAGNSDTPVGASDLDPLPDIFRIEIQPRTIPHPPVAGENLKNLSGRIVRDNGFHYQVQIDRDGSRSVQVRVFNPSMSWGAGRDSAESIDEIAAAVQRTKARRAKLDSLLRAIQE